MTNHYRIIIGVLAIVIICQIIAFKNPPAPGLYSDKQLDCSKEECISFRVFYVAGCEGKKIIGKEAEFFLNGEYRLMRCREEGFNTVEYVY